MQAHKEETPGTGGTEGLETFSRTENPNSAMVDTGKQEATLIAALALRGHAAHALRDGGYVVTHHAYSTTLPNLDALQAFAKRVGAV